MSGICDVRPEVVKDLSIFPLHACNIYVILRDLLSSEGLVQLLNLNPPSLLLKSVIRIQNLPKLLYLFLVRYYSNIRMFFFMIEAYNID